MFSFLVAAINAGEVNDGEGFVVEAFAEDFELQPAGELVWGEDEFWKGEAFAGAEEAGIAEEAGLPEVGVLEKDGAMKKLRP